MNLSSLKANLKDILLDFRIIVSLIMLMISIAINYVFVTYEPRHFFQEPHENGVYDNVEFLQSSRDINIVDMYLENMPEELWLLGADNTIYKMKLPYFEPEKMLQLPDEVQAEHIIFDGYLNDDGCAGGIDFVVTYPTVPPPGFVPIGTYDIVYTAIYTNSAGEQVTATCEFDVIVEGVEAEITGTTDAQCGSSVPAERKQRVSDCPKLFGAPRTGSWRTPACRMDFGKPRDSAKTDHPSPRTVHDGRTDAANPWRENSQLAPQQDPGGCQEGA